MTTFVVVLALMGVLVGVAIYAWLAADERTPPPPQPQPLNPQAVVRLGRIQAQREASQLKNEIDRNIAFAKREARRQMRDL